MPRPEISAVLKLQSTQFVGELRKTRSQLSTFGNNIKQIGGIIASVFVTGTIGRSIKRTIDFADGLGKLSSQLGIGTRAIQEYRFAAERAGLSQAEVDKSLVAFTRRLGAFQRDGGGPAAKSLEELGIRLEDIKDLTTEQTLSLVSDRMARLTNETSKVNIAQELFSESGRRMVNVIGQGSRAFRDMVAPAEKLGAIMSDDLVKQSEDFNDRVSDLTDALAGLGREGIEPVLPALTTFVQKLTDLATADFRGIFEQTGLFTQFSTLTDGVNAATQAIAEFFNTVSQAVPGSVKDLASDAARALGFRDPVRKAAIALPGEEVRALQIADPFAKTDTGATGPTIEDQKQAVALLQESIGLSRAKIDVDKLQGEAKLKFLQDETQLQLTILDLQRQIAIEEAKAKRDIDARREISFAGPSGGTISGSVTERETINARFDRLQQETLNPLREASAELNVAPKTFSDGWRQAFSQFVGDAEGAFGLGQVVARNFATGFQQLMSQQVLSAFDQLESKTRNWNDLLDSTVDTLKRIVAQMIAAVATQAALSAAFGPGGGAAAGAAAGSGSAGGSGGIFAGLFAQGGSFRVNGRGGIDRNLVSLGVSQGERVTVSTPAQQMRGNVSVTVNNNSSAVRADAVERTVPGGGKTIDVVIEDVVDQSIRRGRIGRTLSGTFGLGRTGRVG